MKIINPLRLLLVCYMCAFGTLYAQVQRPLLPVFQQINEEVMRHSEAYYRLEQSIAQNGHRLTGSSNGAKAEAFVYQLLKDYGFEEVEYQPFSLNGWQRSSLDVQVQTQGGSWEALKGVALALTPAESDVEGELIDLDNGLAADYVGKEEQVKGKIVFASLNVMPGSPAGTTSIHRSSKVALAKAHGAKGIILYNSVKGGVLITGTASIDGTLLTLPALSIGLEDGMRLKEALAKQKHQVRIAMRNKTGTFTARNVIARIKGTSKPEEKIVVGGHLDSWDLSPGAVDNGLGAFAVLDMARTFKALQLTSDRTIEFVFFMGEEQGLLGSNAYVQKAQQDGTLDQIKFMLNFDMTNDPKSFYASQEAARGLFTSIGEVVKQVDSTFLNRFGVQVGLYSDHQPFMLQGIAIGGGKDGHLSREALNCYHADCDQMEWVVDSEMRNTVRFSSMLIYGIANAPQWPVKRLNDAEIKKMLQEHQLEEALRIGKAWRWD
jgi:Zn-dependent M28 family amino/carboxypeptidase